jgi:hypothetical protein
VGNVQPQPLVENYTIMDVMEKLKNNHNIQKEFSHAVGNLLKLCPISNSRKTKM